MWCFKLNFSFCSESITKDDLKSLKILPKSTTDSIAEEE